MIFFLSDYSQGAHPKILEALMKTNMEHTDGYGMDSHCQHAAELVRQLIQKPEAAVHMMVGGTPTNITTIAAALRPYEAVVAPREGHIYRHETGGIEQSGHRIIAFDTPDGKLTAQQVELAWEEYEDEHTVIPKMVYISHPTESGSIYTKADLQALRAVCDKHDMYLYMDGARIASALTCPESDLTLPEIANLVDAFYLGGTKNGILLGEALVINNPAIDDHYRWFIKQNRGLLAKGRVIGTQLEALLEGGEDSLFFQLARHANELAGKLRKGLSDMGLQFFGTSATNQIFPILPVKAVEELEKDFMFYRWTPERNGELAIRLVTGWGTTKEDVDAVLAAVQKAIA